MLLKKVDRLFVRFRDRNDGAALAAVFDATSRELFDVACHLVKNASDAEDLVQATFLTAIVKAQSYDGESPVQGWLYGILCREAAKARRNANRTIEPDRLDPRPEPSPAEVAQRQEIPQSVEDALGRLPARYRDVLEPVIRADESPESVARRLGRSPGTVRSQIHRGLERLRRELPSGLAPLPSILFAVRGLPELRASVLRSAGVSTSAAASPIALASASQKSLLLVGAAAVVAGGTWFAAKELATPGSSADVALEHSSSDVRPASKAAEPTTVLAERESKASMRKPDAEEAGTADPATSVEYWLARFGERPDDWRNGLKVAYEIARLSPDEALRIMTAVWPHLSVPVKEQVMKPFVFDGGHVHALKILDLAATDPGLTVQGCAFTCLTAYAYKDFSTDYDAYRRWAERYRDLPIRDVVTSNAKAFVAELLALGSEELHSRVPALAKLGLGRSGAWPEYGVPVIVKQAGGLRVLESLMQIDDAKARQLALEWTPWTGADEPWLRSWVIPWIDTPENRDIGTLAACFGSLARRDCAWACPAIVAYLARPGPVQHGITMQAGMALGEIGDASIVPSLIELLLHEGTGELDYDVGYYSLAKLTGVTWQKGYDGAWWLDWWEKNKMRFPPGVRDAVIRH